jgi:hypothetical protein
MKKQHLQSNHGLHLMSMKFRLRDWLRRPIRILQEAGVRSGTTLLGFGCGRVKLINCGRWKAAFQANSINQAKEL